MKDYETIEHSPNNPSSLINDRTKLKYRIIGLEGDYMKLKKHKKAKKYFLNLNKPTNKLSNQETTTTHNSIENNHEEPIKPLNLHYNSSYKNLRLNSESHNIIIPPLIKSPNRQLSQIFPIERKGLPESPSHHINTNNNMRKIALKHFSPYYPNIKKNPESVSSSNVFFYKYNSDMIKALNSSNNRLGVKSTETSMEEYYEMMADENEKLKKSLESSRDREFLKKYSLPRLPERKRVIEINNSSSHFIGDKHDPSNYEVPPRNRTKRHAYGYLFNH